MRAKYLREALDMTDEFQSRSSRRGSAGQETTEVIVVERPQCNHMDQCLKNTSELVDTVKKNPFFSWSYCQRIHQFTREAT